MKTRFFSIFTAFLFVFIQLASILQQTTGAPSDTLQAIILEKTWVEGIFSTFVGESNIWIIDQDDDGQDELVSCGNGSAFVLEFVAGQYKLKWFGPPLDCYKVAVGDLTGDQKDEIVLASPRHAIHIFDGGSFDQIGEIPNPDGNQVTDIVVDNVDWDDQKEIIITNELNTFVYHGGNFSQKWAAMGKGGWEVAVGNIDDDPTKEIIVNGDPAHILNAVQKSEEWVFEGGFGSAFDVADIDQDGKAEIACLWGDGYSDSIITVFNTNPLRTRWEIGPYFGMQEIALLDVDRDQTREIVIGYGQSGRVDIYDDLDGSLISNIFNEKQGVYGLASGDLDDDGVNEIFWGVGREALLIGDWLTQSIEWISPELDGSIRVTAADIDLDSEVEIVAMSGSTKGGYGGGAIVVYDSQSLSLEWSTTAPGNYFDLYNLAVGQVDTDPALEIIVGGDNWYNSKLLVFDGLSQALEWESSELGSGPPIQLLVTNIDNDANDEIIVALTEGNVFVFDGISGVIEWQLTQLNGIQDIAIGDPNQDSIIDLAVLTYDRLMVFDTRSRTQILNQNYSNGKKLAISRSAPGYPSLFLILHDQQSVDQSLKAFSGNTFSPAWERNFTFREVTSLQTKDLNYDGIDEFIITGSKEYSDGYPETSGLLLIGSLSPEKLGDYDYSGPRSTISNFAAADIDNDDQLEILLGADTFWQLNEYHFEDRYILFSPAVIKQACYWEYFDDFSDPTSGWPIFDDQDYGRFDYLNGEYQIILRNTHEWTFIHTDQQFADSIASIDVRNANAVTGWYGLVFGVEPDWSHLYTFEISPTGEYAIWKYIDSLPGELLATGSSNAIHTGVAWNTLKLMHYGTQVQAYVNDQLLTTINDEDLAAPNQIGISIASVDQPNLEVYFDNFRIRYNWCQLNDSMSSQTSTRQALLEWHAPFLLDR